MDEYQTEELQELRSHLLELSDGYAERYGRDHIYNSFQMLLSQLNQLLEKHPDTKSVTFEYKGKPLQPTEYDHEEGVVKLKFREEPPPTLWDGNHPRQAEWDALWDKLVPDSGEADTPYGEALRALGRLEHDYYNNGFCNAIDRGVITDFYLGFIDHLEEFGAPMDGFKRWMLTQEYSSCDFDSAAARRFNAIETFLLDYDGTQD
jgi:hypothetical protein